MDQIGKRNLEDELERLTFMEYIYMKILILTNISILRFYIYIDKCFKTKYRWRKNSKNIKKNFKKII